MIALNHVSNVTSSLFNLQSASQVSSSFGENFWQNCIMLFFYMAAMVIYAVLIWHFYRELAKRDIFDIDHKSIKDKAFEKGILKKIVDFFNFLILYLLIFPLVSFIFFIVFAAFMIVVSKSQTVEQILFISMTVISACRMASYYSQDLSKDLAKMIPFTLLGVFIIDPSFFSWQEVLDKFLELPSLTVLILQYLAFLVMLEFAMRVVYNIYARFFNPKDDDEDEEDN